jgi:hypothetical protein
LVQIYKTTYIFCNSIIYKNNSFSVSKISLGCIRLLNWTSPWILVTWTLHWRINSSLQSGHYPAYIITLDYANKLYILWHIDYPCAHKSHYSCLSLVKYLKQLLGYQLSLGSHYILFINAKMYLLYSLASLLLLLTISLIIVYSFKLTKCIWPIYIYMYRHLRIECLLS